MKNFITFICLSALIGALGVSCGELPLPAKTIEISPLSDCHALINITPGEETILYAKGGIPYEEFIAICDSLELLYGANNIGSSGGIPIEEESYLGYQDYNVVVDPEAVPNCYEVTMTIEFPESSVPSVMELQGGDYPVVRIDGHTAIVKRYFWAFTDEGADIFISKFERSYLSGCESVDNGRTPDWEKELIRVFSGTIVGTTTMKKLGAELYNQPIIF